MDEATVLWICIGLLVFCNVVVIFYCFRKIHQRNFLPNQWQTELSIEAPGQEETAFSILVRFSELNLHNF